MAGTVLAFVCGVANGSMPSALVLIILAGVAAAAALLLLVRHRAGKGVRYLLRRAPEGPVRQEVPHTFSRHVVAAFLVLNAVGLALIYHGITARSQPLLAVESFAPSGTASILSPIRVRFNLDVAPPGEVGTAPAKPLFTITPAVAGRTRWASARELEFLPDKPFDKAAEYTVQLARDRLTVGPLTLGGETAFTFRTRPLTWTRLEQVGFDDRRRARLALTFDDAIVPADLTKFLRVTNDAGETVAFSLGTNVRAKRVVVATAPLTRDGLFLTIRPGLTGASGPLGIEAEVKKSIDLDFVLALRGLSSEVWRDGSARLEARFSSTADAGRAKPFIRIDPPVPFEVENEYWRLALTGAFAPATRYRVTFLAGLPSTDGKVLGQTVVQSVWTGDVPSSIDFDRAGGYLSRLGNLLVTVKHANLSSARLRITRLYANNVVSFVNRGVSRYRLKGLGEELLDRTLDLDGNKNEMRTRQLDLRDLLGEKARGVLLLELFENDDCWCSDSAVVTVTDLGVAAKMSGRDLLVWVNALREGGPVEAARVCVYTEANQKLYEGRTDPSGLVHFSQADWGVNRAPALITAELTGDLSYLKMASNRLTGDWDIRGRPYLTKGYEAFCYTDRGVYRPGETAHAAVIVRGPDWSAPGQIPVELHVIRPDGRTLSRLHATTDDGGAAEFPVAVPDYAPTGRYRAVLQLPGDDAKSLGDTTVQVEEFLPNRIEATIEAPPGPVTTGEHLAFTATGRYLFGQPTAGLRVEARARFLAASFEPPGWEGFAFGDPHRPFEASEVSLGQRTLDDEGRRPFTLDVPPLAPPAALTAYLTVTLKEVGGRGVTASTSLAVNPYPFYLGIRTDAEGFATVGEPMAFDVAAVLPDGEPADVAALAWTIERVEFNTVMVRDDDGTYRYRSSERAREEGKGTVTLTAGCGRIPFTPTRHGQYRLRVSPVGLPHTQKSAPTASADVHVSAPGWGYFPWSMKRPEEARITTDKATYRPGETARLIVKSPFPGTLLLTVEGDRVHTVQVLTMKANTQEVVIPVRDAYRPNAFVTATIVRAVRPEAPWMAHRAFGLVRLRVDCTSRRLTVGLDAPSEVRPGTKLSVAVLVRDAAGRGVSAGVTVAAVDEGVCALTRFRTPDPWGFFYGDRALAVSTMDLYSRLMPEPMRLRPDKQSVPGGGEPAGPDYDPRRLNPVAAERVKPVALWSGLVRTDETGRATVTFDVSRFVGQLRLMAVAGEGHHAGSAEKAVLVRSPLLVQSSFPRFLAPGDEFVVPLTVFNNTGFGGMVSIGLTLDGPLAFEQPRGRTKALPTTTSRPSRPVTTSRPSRPMTTSRRSRSLTVPAGGQRVLRVRMRVAEATGVGRVTMLARLGDETFEESVELPVRPAAPLTAVVGAGSVKAGTETVLRLPADFFPGTARYQVLFAGEPTVNLAASLRYLLRYPYGCVEQTTSQCLPLLYLRDLAAWVDPDLAPADDDEPAKPAGEIEHYVASGIARVLSMQTPNGGFAYWPGYRDADPWASAYAAQFLVEAKKAGFDVPAASYNAMLDYLKEQLDQTVGAGALEDGPSERPGTQIVSLCPRFFQRMERQAYFCYVLALAGKPTVSWTTRLAEMENDLSATARAHLAGALAAAGKLDRAVTLIGGTMPPLGKTVDTGGNLHSPSRDAALFLSILIDVKPDGPHIPALLSRLEGARVRGRWGTTQENAMALLALGKYARLRAKQPNRFTATVRVPGRDLITFTHADRRRIVGDLAGKDITVSVAGFAGSSSSAGTGTLHYFWLAEGVPVSGQVKEEDRGLRIRRRLLDRAGDLLGEKPLRQGEVVVVELRVTAPRRVENAVLVDLLPAGLEIENPRLATTEGLQATTPFSERATTARSSMSRPIVTVTRRRRPASFESSLSPDRIDIRDDRLILFASLPARESTYYYVARAVTAGRFVLPPVQASCIYDPALASVHGAGRIEVR